jgi:isoleucyl-tRNA synthetase
VKRFEPLSGEVVDVRVKADFRALGRRFGKRTQRVADALHAADPRLVVAALRAEDPVVVEVDGEPVELVAAEVLVTESPRTGWAVESQRGVTIALDVEITPALAAEGTVRDLVRVVQQARRDAGLAVSDRVDLVIGAPLEVLDAVRAHQEYLEGETLALRVTLEDRLDGGFPGVVGDSVAVAVRVVKGSPE